MPKLDNTVPPCCGTYSYQWHSDSDACCYKVMPLHVLGVRGQRGVHFKLQRGDGIMALTRVTSTPFWGLI